MMWSLLTLALIGLGTPTIYRQISAKQPGWNQTYASYTSDTFLQAVTQWPGASGEVAELITSIPGERPMLIMVRNRDVSSSLFGLTLGYLAWPREVKIATVPVESDGSTELRKFSPSALAAVAFCELPAPAYLSAGRPLGPNGTLVIVPHNRHL